MHSERLSAIGELVAGVAHEINNPLQTIVGCVELMIEERPDPETRRDLEIVRQEAARAGQIVRNLLAFVRRSSPDRAAADLNQIVRATAELREYHLRSTTSRCTRAAARRAAGARQPRRDPADRAEPVLNAEQAIADGGPRQPITVRSYSADAHQVVEVDDDGPGISAELRGRVFEPFFTTKDVGEGTGLGLSISLGIASAHGGSLDLVSPGNRARASG